MKWILLAAYAACVPVANWMIGNVGQCIPDGPCLLPMGFGLSAPSGVLVIGAALMLRDAIQIVAGWRWGLIAIGIGAIVSYLLSSPFIVVASVASFVLSELADFAVYTPLAKKRLTLALFASGFVGAVIDSAAFLLIAFGSMDFIGGQILGKLYTVIAASIAIPFVRQLLKGKSA
jgi:uncharacterized PurR-regulated membrane protein YhhQ (DUF165 family)